MQSSFSIFKAIVKSLRNAAIDGILLAQSSVLIHSRLGLSTVHLVNYSSWKVSSVNWILTDVKASKHVLFRNFKCGVFLRCFTSVVTADPQVNQQYQQFFRFSDASPVVEAELYTAQICPSERTSIGQIARQSIIKNNLLMTHQRLITYTLAEK